MKRDSKPARGAQAQQRLADAGMLCRSLTTAMSRDGKWLGLARPALKTKTQTSTETLRGQNAYGLWGRGRFVSVFHNPPKHNPPPFPALHQEPAVSGRFGEALGLSSAFPGSCALDRSRSPVCRVRLAHPPANSLCLCSPYVHRVHVHRSFIVHGGFPEQSPSSSLGFRAGVPLPSSLSSPDLAGC